MQSKTQYFAGSARLRQIVADAAIELFASYKAQSQGPTKAHDPPPNSLCGIVGIKGIHVEATIVLACPNQLLSRTHPSQHNGLLLRDWAGELANQLAGRVKHALWDNGAGMVYVTPPCVFNAGFLRVQVSTMDRMPPIELRVEGWPVVIWFDGEMDTSVELEPANVEPWASEGSMLLF